MFFCDFLKTSGRHPMTSLGKRAKGHQVVLNWNTLFDATFRLSKSFLVLGALVEKVCM